MGDLDQIDLFHVQREKVSAYRPAAPGGVNYKILI